MDTSGHAVIEKNMGLMIVLIIVAISFGGLVEIVPLFFQKSTTEPVAGLKPYTALQLSGRDVYIREGCYNCHSQMIRPFRAETERYGHYSVAGEFVYDHPFQWGSKRTGPDLARVGGRYSDDWHRVHLINPRDLVPESNMPAYAVAGHVTGGCRRRAGQDACAAQAGRSLYRRRYRQGRGRGQGQNRTGCADCVPAGHGYRVAQCEVTMDINLVRSILTAVMFAVFMGIVLWAWSSRRKRISRLPRACRWMTIWLSRKWRGITEARGEHNNERFCSRRLESLHRHHHAGQPWLPAVCCSN